VARTGAICTFAGDVNGQRRYTAVHLQPDERTLDQAEAIVMNTWPLYKVFYRGATEADYNADVLNRTLTIYHHGTTVITEQDPK
jgi:hypothetical protein